MKKFAKIVSVFCCMLLALTLIACDGSGKELVLSADKTSVGPGKTVTLSAVYKDEDDKTTEVEDVTYEIVAGSDYATLSENILTINANAPLGSEIKVVAKVGKEKSNEVKVLVSVPLEGISISAGGLTNVTAGELVTLTKTLNPELSDVKPEDISWVVEEGVTICNIIGDHLYVKPQATTGQTIKVKAKHGDIESNSLSFTVGYPLEGINLVVAGSSNISNGSSRSLITQLNPTNATDVDLTWEFSAGESLCSIVNKVITINDDAQIGSVIKFRAVCGEIKSNEVTVIVGTPIETISISAVGFSDQEEVKITTDKTLLVDVGVTPTKANVQGVTLNITEGGSFASVSGNSIVINPNTPYGTQIKVKANSGTIYSNELVFQYGIAVSSVQIEASATTIVKGNTAILSATVSPNNATNSSVEYVFVEGEQYASIIGNIITIKEDALTGAKVKVKAVSVAGGVQSTNILEFTVKATKEEENASKFMLAVSDDRLILDKNGGNVPVLTVDVYDYNFSKVQDKVIKYKVVEGVDLLKTTANGYSCNFEILGHGQAVVEVSIEGTEVKENVVVDVIVPPTAIFLPEVFADRTKLVYNFSKLYPTTNEVEKLPFVATPVGDKVCQNLTYTFMHEDGTSGSEVATWDDGEITFNKTGKVTVLISSNSGSRVEVNKVYTFNINEGYNVYTYEQLQAVASSSKYKGEPINIVVLEKPDGSANNYEYGYDLVSKAGLIAKDQQTFNDIYSGRGQKIMFANRSGHINGNGHKIDVSQVRAISIKEIEDNGKKQEDFWPALISFIPWAPQEDLDAGFVLTGTYNVKIYDLEIVGNCPIDYTGDLGTEGIRTGRPVGVMYAGIVIGDYGFDPQYYIDIKNVTVSQFAHGIRFQRVVGNGLAENIHAYNCYTNGLEVTSSVLRLKDVKFGKCGAAGIELAPANSDKAGETREEKQTVTFEGSLDVSQNHTNGQTEYFKNYLVMGQYMIPDVIQMVLNNGLYNENQQNHMQEVDSDNPYVFICFVLSDLSSLAPNHSVCNYPGYQEGGIVKATDLPKEGYDTTHQYIELDVDFGMGSVGKVLLYNHYYGK